MPHLNDFVKNQPSITVKIRIMIFLLIWVLVQLVVVKKLPEILKIFEGKTQMLLVSCPPFSDSWFGKVTKIVRHCILILSLFIFKAYWTPYWWKPDGRVRIQRLTLKRLQFLGVQNRTSSDRQESAWDCDYSNGTSSLWLICFFFFFCWQQLIVFGYLSHLKLHCFPRVTLSLKGKIFQSHMF